MEHFIKNPMQLQHIQTPDIFETLAHSEREFVSYSLIHFKPLVSFYASCKHQKISGSMKPVAWDGLMYQLFFRTPNLVLLLYPLLRIKSMTYSLAVLFFSQPLVMRYRTLNPLSTNFTKCRRRNLPTNCLSVFGHFEGLALKGLITHPIGDIWQKFGILDMAY